MTDEMTSTNPSDESTQSNLSAEDVTAKHPVASDEATQTMPTIVEEATQVTATEVALDEMDTVTMAPTVPGESVQTTPVAELIGAVPTTPQYEQFGTPIEQVQPAPDPVMVAPNFYAQSAYTPQPGQMLPGQPVTQAPVQKRRSPVLWMVLIALVAFLLGGSGVFAYTTNQAQAQTQAQAQALAQIPSPNGTLQKYCDSIKNSDAQGIYDLLSAQAKTHSSLDDIQKVFDSLNALSTLSPDSSMKFGDCKFSNIKVSHDRDLAVATVTLTLDMTVNGQTLSIGSPSLLSLVVEHNQWKIDFSNFSQTLSGLGGGSFLTTPTPTSN